MPVSDLFAAYEFFTDFGPEPTEDELAAIDAAPVIPDTVSLEDWARSSWAQTALRIVGPPDGTATWRLAFVSELLGYYDAVKRAQEGLKLSVGRLEELRLEFSEARQGSGGRNPEAVLAEILSSGLTLKAAANYLDTTPLGLARVLCRDKRNAAGLVQADHEIRQNGCTWVGVSKRCGVSEHVVATHAKRCGVAAPGSGTWKYPKEIKARCLDLRRSGRSYGQIVEAIEGEYGQRLCKETVVSYCRRSRVSA